MYSYDIIFGNYFSGISVPHTNPVTQRDRYLHECIQFFYVRLENSLHLHHKDLYRQGSPLTHRTPVSSITKGKFKKHKYFSEKLRVLHKQSSIKWNLSEYESSEDFWKWIWKCHIQNIRWVWTYLKFLRKHTVDKIITREPKISDGPR